MHWEVVDRKTGKLANVEELAGESWVREKLVWPDLEGFAIGEDGCIYLLDECGNWEYCDPTRFYIRWPDIEVTA